MKNPAARTYLFPFLRDSISSTFPSKLAAVLIGFILLLCGCQERPRTPTAQQYADSLAVKVLAQDYAALREQFNADSTKVRLLALLSPT